MIIIIDNLLFEWFLSDVAAGSNLGGKLWATTASQCRSEFPWILFLLLLFYFLNNNIFLWLWAMSSRSSFFISKIFNSFPPHSPFCCPTLSPPAGGILPPVAGFGPAAAVADPASLVPTSQESLFAGLWKPGWGLSSICARFDNQSVTSL